MSKAKVKAALRALELGKSASEVRDELIDVDGTFIRKRLGHLIRAQGSETMLARRLWLELFTEPAPVPPDSSLTGQSAAVAIPLSAADTTTLSAEAPPAYVALDEPSGFLSWLVRNAGGVLRLDSMRLFEVWGIAASATLARAEAEKPLRIVGYESSAAGRFAHAIGLAQLVSNSEPTEAAEPGRTYKLRRLRASQEIEPVASSIAKLLVPDQEHEATRRCGCAENG